jgi:hypothetical protein
MKTALRMTLPLFSACALNLTLHEAAHSLAAYSLGVPGTRLRCGAGYQPAASAFVPTLFASNAQRASRRISAQRA